MKVLVTDGVGSGGCAGPAYPQVDPLRAREPRVVGCSVNG